MRARAHGGGAALIALCAASVAGQVPNASPAATGLGGAYTARARGYDAVAWNPANLGLSGTPDFSFSMLAVHGSSGLAPISLGDIASYSGKVLPYAQRETWLEAVTSSGGEHGRLDGGITALALSAGPFAVQVSASVAGATHLNADAFEAIMFGNAGRTGAPKDLALDGSTFNMGAFTTVAASYAKAFTSETSGRHLSFGVTGKYVLGNALGIAQDQGTTATTSGVTVSFPFVYSRFGSDLVVGSGVGMDVGAAWSQDRLTVGATVQNAFNSFAWDETKLYSKPGTALFNGDSNDSDFDDQPYAAAPAPLRARVAGDRFKPIVAAGIAYAMSSALTMSSDVRQQLGDALLFGPKTQVSGGVEYTGIPKLRLRGGACYITDGWGVSGGFGLELGKYEVGVGLGTRSVNGGREPIVTLNVLSFR